MIAFSSDDELMMGLTMVKDDTFRIFIKGKTLAGSALSLLKVGSCMGYVIHLNIYKMLVLNLNMLGLPVWKMLHHQS